MSYERLYRILVPNAPLNRRTDRDIFTDENVLLRVNAANILREANRPGLQQPRLISSSQGSLDTLLFSLPNGTVAAPDLAAAFQSLLRELRAGTHFVVVHHGSQRATIEGWFSAAGHEPGGIEWVPLPEFANFTDWAEDAYVALEDAADGSLYLMEPWQFPRAGDALIADAVEESEAAGVRASQAPLMFQGGNCLIGDDFWLLGKDYIADSVELVGGGRPPVRVPEGTQPEPFVRQLFTQYLESGRRLHVLGTTRRIPLNLFYGTREGDRFFLDLPTEGVGTFQPIFHIDMFVTLVGRDGDGPFDVLVGSPGMADRMLGTRSPFALDNAYDELASQVAGTGARVHRNPLVHRPTPGETVTVGELRARAADASGSAALDRAVKELVAAGAGERTAVTARSWHHVTWNNCLVENSASRGKHVYLPTFGHGPSADLRPVDEYMEALWRRLGFTPHMLGDFNGFALRQGVVHCIKKFLRRGL